ncbi:hypothetical protein [Actinacidiphila glaucinigra]|uniref:hypothetical protein n=1 Tax=Actinacidiphila glaucinigra TaxID=235986 RepID=UPI002E364DDD|nr:hypothetical protein [Actinacidiphila glaucinigra]
MDFDTHELCRRPCLHARQAGRSPDREAALEPVLTMTGRATASEARISALEEDLAATRTSLRRMIRDENLK